MTSGNRIGAAGASYLTRGLKENSTLEELNLEGNKNQEFRRRFAPSLAPHVGSVVICLAAASPAIRTIATTNFFALLLSILYVRNTDICNTRVWCYHVTCYRFVGSEIGHEGAAHLAEAVKENSTLKKLNLERKLPSSKALLMQTTVMLTRR